MTQLINPEVLEYADAHTTAPPAHLEEVDASTKADFPAWGMMVGRQEGRFLEMLVFALQATSVLEIGTFTGYSSIAMASGLAKGGAIISLEVDPHHAKVARGNIAAAGYESHISVIEGPALRSLEELQGPFDLVFIDADKVSYDAYYEAVLPKLAAHGLIVVDNTLQSGRRSGLRGAPPRERPGAARLQRQGRQRRPRRLRAHDRPRRRDPDPPRHYRAGPALTEGPPACSTTTSTCGRTRSTRRRCAWTSWPRTASGPRRPG